MDVADMAGKVVSAHWRGCVGPHWLSGGGNCLQDSQTTEQC